MRSICRLLPFLVAPLLWADQAPASVAPDQTPASQAQQPQPADQTTDPSATNTPKKTKGTSNDRLFYTLPNFLTLEDAGKVPPLSNAQKFRVIVRESFDPVELVWYGALAGIAQWDDAEHQYGQGAKGYAQRYAVRFADGTIENFMVKAVFPSVLHQDPRYFQSGKGSFFRRTGYAVSRVFVTRSDSGAAQFNFSEVFGSATAAGISAYTYHLKDERNVANAVSVWGSQLAYDTLSDIIKEFWPDIRRKLHHAKPGQAQ